jgi:hypothetical protein
MHLEEIQVLTVPMCAAKRRRAASAYMATTRVASGDEVDLVGDDSAILVGTITLD